MTILCFPAHCKASGQLRPGQQLLRGYYDGQSLWSSNFYLHRVHGVGVHNTCPLPLRFDLVRGFLWLSSSPSIPPGLSVSSYGQSLSSIYFVLLASPLSLRFDLVRGFLWLPSIPPTFIINNSYSTLFFVFDAGTVLLSLLRSTSTRFIL